MPPYAYIDTSALVKLVVAEHATAALERHLAERTGLLSSALTTTELHRACRRGVPKRVLQHIDDVLEAVVFLDVSSAILRRAAGLSPVSLRSFDAIHLATALSVSEVALDVITYDARLASAALAHGLTVVAPGQ